MQPSERRPWMRLSIVIGLMYTAVGVVFGEMAGAAGSNVATIRWRWAAWALCLSVYAGHILYEANWRGHPPRSASWHAAFGTGIGGLGLAIAAITHAIRTGEGNLPLLLAAIAAFPVIVTIPAFLVGIVIATVASRIARR